jgi:hypothetical protein
VGGRTPAAASTFAAETEWEMDTMRLDPDIGSALRTCLFLLLTLSCSLTYAVVINPGQSVTFGKEEPFDPSEHAPPPSFANRPFSIDFGGGSILQGHIIDNVLIVNGTLAFETEVFIDSGPSGALQSLSRTNYAGFVTDVRPEPDRGGSLVPNQAQRSSPPGSSVQFNFDNSTPPDIRGSSSSFFAILTDATQFAEVGTFQVGVDGRFSDPLPVFSPVGVPVPEPTAWLTLLAGIGLAAATAVRRRT